MLSSTNKVPTSQPLATSPDSTVGRASAWGEQGVVEAALGAGTFSRFVWVDATAATSPR